MKDNRDGKCNDKRIDFFKVMKVATQKLTTQDINKNLNNSKLSILKFKNFDMRSKCKIIIKQYTKTLRNFDLFNSMTINCKCSFSDYI